jgi:peroxiredoxin
MPGVTPRTPAPTLEVPLVSGGTWSLAEQDPESFTLVVFYRGSHCRKCKDQLSELDSTLDALAEVGATTVVAVSGDDEERARRTVEEWKLRRLPVGYGLTVEGMKAWDLYVSKGVKDGEPDQFNEPGMFLVRPDGTLYSAHIQSMPFARPHLADLVKALGFINNDYPARGEA